MIDIRQRRWFQLGFGTLLLLIAAASLFVAVRAAMAGDVRLAVPTAVGVAALTLPIGLALVSGVHRGPLRLATTRPEGERSPSGRR